MKHATMTHGKMKHSGQASLIAILGLATALSAHAAAETELKGADGSTVIRYAVEPPENPAPAGTTDPARQLGLILCFPEHDRPTGDEILPVREALIRLGIRDGYVLLAGHPQKQKFGAADDEPIAKLIAWAKKTYPINPRRVYMYGKGEGGKISGEFAMLHPDVVTAGITYSWGWWRMPAEIERPVDALGSAPEFYMVLGLRDLSFHLTTVRDTYLRVSTKGYHTIYREFEELGARTYHPPSNDDALAWATRLRNKNIPPSPEEVKLMTHGVGIRDGYYPDLALVGGVQAGQALGKMLQSPDANMRATAAETFVHGIFSEAAIGALAGRASDPSPKVRRTVLRALAVNANWRSEAAQTALEGLALHPEKTPEQADRVAAVDGLVYAVRYQVRGAIQDPALFRTLVALLDDKDEELRTMASNALAPVRDRTFRGDLGRPEQKTPPGGWQRWVDETTAKAAGYAKDYNVCDAGEKTEGETLFCKGRDYLSKNPATAFGLTRQAAELEYVPAEAALGIMYANGKGVEQDYAAAAKWWTKAAEGGHLLAAGNLSMLYRGGSGFPPDMKQSEKWAKFVEERTAGEPH